MRLDTRVLFLPALVVIRGILAQQTATATSGTPDVTYPDTDAFIFCSAQDCTGTCEVLDTTGIPKGTGETAPNGMGFQSIYWYDPGDYAWTLYTCLNYSTCDTAVAIGPNTCYDLYYDGAAADYGEVYYLVDN